MFPIEFLTKIFDGLIDRKCLFGRKFVHVFVLILSICYSRLKFIITKAIIIYQAINFSLLWLEVYPALNLCSWFQVWLKAVFVWISIWNTIDNHLYSCFTSIIFFIALFWLSLLLINAPVELCHFSIFPLPQVVHLFLQKVWLSLSFFDCSHRWFSQCFSLDRRCFPRCRTFSSSSATFCCLILRQIL